MEIENVTNQELLALLDNRFDILTGNASRDSGPTLSWVCMVEDPNPLKVLPRKLNAVKEIRSLLRLYEERIKETLTSQ